MLPSQALSEAIAADWVSSGDYRIRPEAIQPASIDLRLGDFAWALRCSFLPDVDSTVEEKIEGLAFQRVDLRDVTVERLKDNGDTEAKVVEVLARAAAELKKS